MNDPFEKKVRAAAVAGWWVILVGYALLTLTWDVYLVLVSARPEGMRAMWGGKTRDHSAALRVGRLDVRLLRIVTRWGRRL
jgi:hypothetical protein